MTFHFITELSIVIFMYLLAGISHNFIYFMYQIFSPNCFSYSTGILACIIPEIIIAKMLLNLHKARTKIEDTYKAAMILISEV